MFVKCHLTFRLCTTFWPPVQANAKAYYVILTPPLRLQGGQNVGVVSRGSEADRPTDLGERNPEPPNRRRSVYRPVR